MHLKFHFLITLYTISIISKIDIVDAGSKLTTNVSMYRHLNLNAYPPIQPLIPPLHMMNDHGKKHHVPIREKSMEHLHMNSEIAYTKDLHRRKINLQENDALSEQSTDLPKTFTELYGKKIRQLGSGGQGEVILTEKLNKFYPNGIQRFAVKIFNKKPYHKTTAQYEKMILNEFEIGYGLDHENIVQIYDLLKNEDGHWCLVMEYLEGIPLHHMKSKYGRKAKQKTPIIVNQLICGLSYLHSKKIAHGNIKPSNGTLLHQFFYFTNIRVLTKKNDDQIVIFTYNNVVKIFDFGISTQVGESKKSSKSLGIHGTRQYLAPEAFLSYSHPFTAPYLKVFSREYNLFKADVFSCGVIFYILFSEWFPWESAAEEDIVYQKYKQDPKKWFEEKETRLFNPIKLPAFVKNMLDPDPEKRNETDKIKEEDSFKSLVTKN